MKKVLLLAISVAMFVLVVPTSQATDVCSNDAHSSADFYVETTRASWLMSQSCVDSEIVTTMPQGSVMHVVGKTEGWHKLVTESGLQGWMWEDFVTPTSKPFNPAEPEPEPEPEPEVEYVPMRDVSGHKYEEAIWYVYNNEIVQGYPDGSYKPDQTINRAELMKIVIEAMYNNEFNAFEGMGCFNDVVSTEWFAKYICFALSEAVVEGYPDGGFKPADEINFVEALKIIMIGFGYEYLEGDPWYINLVNEATDLNFIPDDIESNDQLVTRGQVAEIITRIMKYNAGELEEYLQ